MKEWCKKHEGHEKENYVQEMPVRFLSRDEEDNQKTTEGVVAFRALRCVQCDEMLYIDQISTYDIQKEFKNGREK